MVFFLHDSLPLWLRARVVEVTKDTAAELVFMSDPCVITCSTNATWKCEATCPPITDPPIPLTDPPTGLATDPPPSTQAPMPNVTARVNVQHLTTAETERASSRAENEQHVTTIAGLRQHLTTAETERASCRAENQEHKQSPPTTSPHPFSPNRSLICSQIEQGVKDIDTNAVANGSWNFWDLECPDTKMPLIFHAVLHANMNFVSMVANKDPVCKSDTYGSILHFAAQQKDTIVVEHLLNTFQGLFNAMKVRANVTVNGIRLLNVLPIHVGIVRESTSLVKTFMEYYSKWSDSVTALSWNTLTWTAPDGKVLPLPFFAVHWNQGFLAKFISTYHTFGVMANSETLALYATDQCKVEALEHVYPANAKSEFLATTKYTVPHVAADVNCPGALLVVCRKESLPIAWAGWTAHPNLMPAGVANKKKHIKVIQLLENMFVGAPQCPGPTKAEYHNLVFEGGGPKGMGFLGALRVFDKQFDLALIKRVAGTSVGAITAFTLALGLNLTHIETVVTKMDPVGMLVNEDATKFWGMMTGFASGLVTGQGLSDGKKFLDLFKKLARDHFNLTQFEELTFGGLAKCARDGTGGARHLTVVITKVPNVHGVPEQVTLSSETCDKDNTCDVVVASAVRASMSLPFAFWPHRLERWKSGGGSISHSEDLYIDGGLLWNYPIDVFDNVNSRTLGFMLQPAAIQTWLTDPNARKGGIPENGIQGGARSVGNSFFNAQLAKIASADVKRSVMIDPCHITAYSFDITEADKAMLQRSGEHSMTRFVREQKVLNNLPPETSFECPSQGWDALWSWTLIAAMLAATYIL